MYLARFSYDVLPVNRQRAVDFIKREVQAARARNLKARLLIPLTRGHGGAGLQFEIEMKDLDQLYQFRREDAGQWMPWVQRNPDGAARSGNPAPR